MRATLAVLVLGDLIGLPMGVPETIPINHQARQGQQTKPLQAAAAMRSGATRSGHELSRRVDQ